MVVGLMVSAAGGLWLADRAPHLWCVSLSRLAPRELERLVLLGKAQATCSAGSTYVYLDAKVSCSDAECGGLWREGERIIPTQFDPDPGTTIGEQHFFDERNACVRSGAVVGRYFEDPTGWYVIGYRCGDDLFVSYNWQRPLSEMPWMQNVPP
ncbi:hypothetical protein LBMAG42_12410 [Deltaproteobacteria bacterium]|nr:hypothetical protein LBMAG42_12410 [Deltaproteobacteria bacterium]